MAVGPLSARPLHSAARVEDAVHRAAEPALRRRGWRETVVAYTGYGAPGWVRVLARVVLSPEGWVRRSPAERVRGWRSFTTLSVMHAPVVLEVGGREHEVRADRGGYIDRVVQADLAPGWASVRLRTPGAEPVEAPVRIVDPDVRFGIVSDVDDTVMVTALPRPLLAGWNTFVLDEAARAAVPGMAVLYERLTTRHPGTPLLYLSTGAWNVAPTLTRFLSPPVSRRTPPADRLGADRGPLVPKRARPQARHPGPAGE